MWNVDDLLVVATSGAIAGVAKTFVSHPLDTVKVHLQNNLTPPGSVLGLYRGIAVPLARNGFEHSLHFFLRNVVEGAMVGMGYAAAASNPFLVGFLAGFPQALFATPMDYFRLQLQLNKVPKLANSMRGLPFVTLKESVSGMVFFGFYELLKTFVHPGVAGSCAALSAMMTTYPLDTFKARIQAGQTVKSAAQMSMWTRGLPWAIGKCLSANFVALTMYETVRRIAIARRCDPRQLAACHSTPRFVDATKTSPRQGGNTHIWSLRPACHLRRRTRSHQLAFAGPRALV